MFGRFVYSNHLNNFIQDSIVDFPANNEVKNHVFIMIFFLKESKISNQKFQNRKNNLFYQRLKICESRFHSAYTKTIKFFFVVQPSILFLSYSIIIVQTMSAFIHGLDIPEFRTTNSIRLKAFVTNKIH